MNTSEIGGLSNTVKNITDAGAGSAVIYSWIASLTPFLNFTVLVLAIAWGIYRVHDIRLSVKIKQNELDKYNENN